MTETTIYLKDYQPFAFDVTTINLSFDIYNEHVVVQNRMSLKRRLPGPLCLNGDELELSGIVMNNASLSEKEYRMENGNLWIDECPDECEFIITTKIYPQNNTQLSGLFRSNSMFCTQCEAEGFRRITFFPDRPDVLTSYTVKITADKATCPVLLSNGNLMASEDEPGGRHSVLWQDPFKKPSYLFALVAGNLVCVEDTFVTCSGKTVDLKIYVEPGNADKCDYAMISLKKAMRWDEEVYGREYDLSIFMIVAVSDFNMGAMENKGLNIFNSKYILARPDTATDQDFAGIESVVAHEYFHNWTGNRVTCRDWFQLSLKEGLTVFRDQEFSRDMNSRDVNRIQDVKLLKATQFPEDAGNMAHPVRPLSYQEINNFYTATIYNKGAEVIRMQHTLLGEERFRRGMDLYFSRNDGKAVTIDDFVGAMEDANDISFSQLKRWYSQAGTPTVKVATAFQGDTLTLTLSQSCPPTPECREKEPFHIPLRIALFDSTGAELPLQNDLLELSEKEQTVTFSGLQQKPLVSLLRDFSAPVLLDYSQSEEDKLALLRFESNGYAKWNAAQDLALKAIQTFLHTENQQEKTLPDSLVGAFHHVLTDDSLDPALKAELLMPPGFEEVIAGLEEVNVATIEAARDTYRSQLGNALYPELAMMYESLWRKENNQIDGKAFGQRKLRNTCLWLMMKADEKQTLSLCHRQFAKKGTMTDQMAAFSLLAACHEEPLRQKVIDDFYHQWSDNELVMDKWFTVQAVSELPHALARVRLLLEHPLFSIKNPNKVRSVIGAFTQGNSRHFHAEDGSGYAFLGDMLLMIDPINPQIAARLATPFARWRKFDGVRQEAIKFQLRRLQKVDLSKDLAEVVTKSLV